MLYKLLTEIHAANSFQASQRKSCRSFSGGDYITIKHPVHGLPRFLQKAEVWKERWNTSASTRGDYGYKANFLSFWKWSRECCVPSSAFFTASQLPIDRDYMQTSTLNLCSQNREYALPRISHQWIPNATTWEIWYVEVFKLPYYCALPMHIKEGWFQCSGYFDTETVSCCFPLRKLAFTLGWDQVNTNNWYVWWSWQSRWEVIKIILTHYFKQTERASMRGIKERGNLAREPGM